MRITESKINPLKDFLVSLTKCQDPKEGVLLNADNIAIMALFFNSGGVICETKEELVKILCFLEEAYGIIEVKEGKVRITEYGKEATK